MRLIDMTLVLLCITQIPLLLIEGSVSMFTGLVGWGIAGIAYFRLAFLRGR